MSSVLGQTIKVVVLGDTGVGKSSLALRFVSNIFRPYSESTIGASYMSKSVTVDSDLSDSSSTEGNMKSTFSRTIDFKIWDTAGQEKYRSLAPMYYRGAGAALLVFDITNASSFKVLQSWVNELRANGPPDIIMVLCGNKCDLDEKRQVNKDEAEEYAKSLQSFYIETSAKDDVNVFKAFEEIAKKVPFADEDSIGILETNQSIFLNEQNKERTSYECC